MPALMRGIFIFYVEVFLFFPYFVIYEKYLQVGK